MLREMMKLLLFSALPVLVAASSSPSVTIDAGTLQGGRCDTSDAVFYKSIPFAEPPVGDLRFEPPQQYNKTYPDGILNATIRAPSCVQFGSELVPAGAQQEDCLYLDLWAPSNASADSKLPVKVWVFGGSHASSGISYALYDGCNIVDDGSIYVGLNYRMGPLGYMALDKTGVSGNQGIKDILLGLEWIQRNIAAFGGDPKKVLLFGQSSGAEDIFTISTLAQAPSLINGVVAESGGGRNIADKKVLQRLAVSYARDLQCSPTNVECLKSKSVDELKKANSNNTLLSTGIGHDGDIGLSNSKTSQWYPTVDGKLITEQPVSRGSRVPIIFGSNQQEGTTYAFEQFIDYPATITPSGYKSFLRKNFGGAAQMVEKYYPLSKFETLTQPIAQELHLNKTVHTAFAVIEAMSVVITDYDYKCSAYQGALVTSQNGVPSWTYEFTHNSSCPWLDTQTLLTKEMGISWSAMTEIVGATHTSEIPYLFGNLYDQPMQSGSCNATKSELQLSAQMRSLWTAMAENGSPSTDAIHWHEFQKQGNGSLTPGVTFENLTVSGTIDYSVCELWLKVYQYLESSNSTATPTPSRGSASATASPSSTPTQYSIAAATVPESIFGLRLAFLLIGLAMVW